jgi:ferredoxin
VNREVNGALERRLAIAVDHDLCVGSTLCTLIARGTFALNENGQSIVRDPDGDPAAAVLDAAVQCPLAAIRVRDADTGEVLFGAG